MSSWLDLILSFFLSWEWIYFIISLPMLLMAFNFVLGDCTVAALIEERHDTNSGSTSMLRSQAFFRAKKRGRWTVLLVFCCVLWQYHVKYSSLDFILVRCRSELNFHSHALWDPHHQHQANKTSSRHPQQYRQLPTAGHLMISAKLLKYFDVQEDVTQHYSAGGVKVKGSQSAAQRCDLFTWMLLKISWLQVAEVAPRRSTAYSFGIEEVNFHHERDDDDKEHHHTKKDENLLAAVNKKQQLAYYSGEINSQQVDNSDDGAASMKRRIHRRQEKTQREERESSEKVTRASETSDASAIFVPMGVEEICPETSLSWLEVTYYLAVFSFLFFEGVAMLTRVQSLSKNPSQTSQNTKYHYVTHYCSKCEAYVEGLDHHCYFIHNCVGKRNILSFILILISVLTFTTILFLQCGTDCLRIFELCYELIHHSFVEMLTHVHHPDIDTSFDPHLYTTIVSSILFGSSTEGLTNHQQHDHINYSLSFSLQFWEIALGFVLNVFWCLGSLALLLWQGYLFFFLTMLTRCEPFMATDHQDGEETDEKLRSGSSSKGGSRWTTILYLKDRRARRNAAENKKRM